MTHDEMIAVIQAHKEGRRIRCRCKEPQSEWCSCPGPLWDFDSFDYEVAREPRKLWIKWSVPASCAPWESVISKKPNAPGWQEVTEQF